MKIAVAQISCVLGDIAANIANIGGCASRAREAGAELVVFPEMADTGYAMPVIRKCAQPWSEGAIPALRTLARELKIALICGVSERDGDRIYNTQVFLDADGAIIAKYRKTHLFSPAPIEEHTCFTAGHEFVTVPHGEFQFGLSICYDLRFPEVYRHLALAGANVFAVSSAWPYPRVSHLRALAIARAVENQSYLLLSNRVGTDDGVTFCGSSAIIDPSGRLLAEGSADREDLLDAEINVSLAKEVRGQMPVLQHRRADLY